MRLVSCAGVELNVFHLGDYNIPYGYSPVLVASEDYLRCGLGKHVTVDLCCWQLGWAW